MRLTEAKLRRVIREEYRSMKYEKAAKPAYNAIKEGDKEKLLMELRSMLHTAGSVMLSGEQLIDDRRLQSAMDRVEEAKLILKEIQQNG